MQDPLRPRRPWFFWPCVFLALSGIVIFLDPRLADLAQHIKPRGDLRRELELLQQFGAPASVLIAFLLTMSLAPEKARRFLDWALAAAVVGIGALAGKILVGRPRPRFDDPFHFNGPFSPYPFPTDDQPDRQVYSWQLTEDGVEQLWSYPSSHTTTAVVFAVFLAIVFPRLRVFAIAMAALVASCRVLFGAHYPADTLAGAALATAIAPPIIKNGLGVRLLDMLWIRFIDKNASPAFRPTGDNDG